MTIRNVHLLIREIKRKCAKNRFCHFVVSRMIYGILPHEYDIISGILPKYLQKKKNQQHLQASIFNFAWFYRRQPLKECNKLGPSFIL